MSKVLVFGDSIAYGKWDSEGGWVARLRKYIDETYNLGKGGNFQVYNLGIPGDVVPRIAERFEKELLYRIPPEENTNRKNLIIFAAGINDSCPNNWLTQKQTEESIFKQSIRNMVHIAQKYQCSIVVIGLTPINLAKSNGLLFSDEEVEKYDIYLSEICKELNIPKLTFFSELQEEKFSELLVDPVHPNDKGHEILAKKIKQFINDKKILEDLVSY